MMRPPSSLLSFRPRAGRSWAARATKTALLLGAAAAVSTSGGFAPTASGRRSAAMVMIRSGRSGGSGAVAVSSLWRGRGPLFRQAAAAAVGARSFPFRTPSTTTAPATAAATAGGLSTSSRLLASSSSSSSRSTDQGETSETNSNSNSNSSNQKKKVPVTLLAGFLGSGKTSALRHLLENKENLRIGVIVNDMASVNIDRKQLAAAASAAASASASNNNNKNNNSADPNDDNPQQQLQQQQQQQPEIIELQNGCACCSLQDELLFSVERLVADDRPLDAIVVELSGVADPAAVRHHWQQQVGASGGNSDSNGWADAVERTPRIVTLLDAATFGTDYLAWDTAQERWSAALGGGGESDDCAGGRKVAELLAEQCEAADLLLVNKVDLLLGGDDGGGDGGGEKETNNPALQVPCAVARALNAKADLVTVKFGRLAPRRLLGLPDEDKPEEATSTVVEKEEEDSACTDPDCTDPSHSHSHSHSHADDHNDSAASHGAAAAAAACTDPDCTDHSHSHSHSHSDDHAGTSPDQLGISSFVYRAARPFHIVRLMRVLNRWPVPIKDTLDVGVWQDPASAFAVPNSDGSNSASDSPFVGVLRSKGFCWFAPQRWSGGGNDAWRHETAMFWSHAGRHFGISAAGKWWGALPERKMRHYFVDQPEEYERILREDFQTEEWKDRRQEIVFIGTANALNETSITATLNACLCTDREMDEYRQRLRNYMDTLFMSPVAAQSGLFDVGGVDHMDMR